MVMIAAAIPSANGSPTTFTAHAACAIHARFTTRHVIAVTVIHRMAASSPMAAGAEAADHLMEVEDFTSHLEDDGAI